MTTLTANTTELADATPTAPPAATLRSVSNTYGDTTILREIDLTVGAGEIVALVGRSGSGKSTILRVLAGLSDDHTGEVSTDGAPAIAFQEPRLFPWRRVLANVSYGRHRSGSKGKSAEAAARSALDEVGLADKADAWPLTLSGGQAGRVSLARALVAQPQLLLLDEPFGALDALTRRSMHSLLLNLWREHGFGVLLVTHDVDEAVALADRVLVLHDGTIDSEFTIDLPRPRERSSRLAEYERDLLSALGVSDG